MPASCYPRVEAVQGVRGAEAVARHVRATLGLLSAEQFCTLREVIALLRDVEGCSAANKMSRGREGGLRGRREPAPLRDSLRAAE